VKNRVVLAVPAAFLCATIFASCASGKRDAKTGKKASVHEPRCLLPKHPLNRYPIVLHHGFMGFEKILSLGYFHKVPRELFKARYAVCVTQVSPAQSIVFRARQLARQTDRILKKTGAMKVNIVAHSMGGLDARYMISSLKYYGRVASLSTISTPHRGSELADAGLDKFSNHGRKAIAFFLNLLGSGLNRSSPFRENHALRAVKNLSTDYARIFNQENPNRPEVHYQSWAGSTGTKKEVKQGLKKDQCGALCYGYKIIRKKVGPNDGMVSVQSARWGEFQGVKDADHFELIGHLPFGPWKRNSTNFNHLEFYVSLVQGLVKLDF